MPPGPYRATTCRGRELNCGSQTYFLTTQGRGGPPRMMIIPMPGPPPRQHKHERQYTPSIHPFIPTRRIWNDDYDGQMTFGDLGGPKVSWHLSYRWEKPRKNFTQETCPDRGSNPGQLRDKRACYHLLHSGGRNNYHEKKYSLTSIKLSENYQHLCYYCWEFLSRVNRKKKSLPN